MDTPMFLVTEKQKMTPAKAKMSSATTEAIQAVMDTLLQRGMWSKYHHTHWSNFLKEMTCIEKLHLWWDSITTGSMFEVESTMGEEPEVEIEMPLKAFHKMKNKGK